MLTDRYRRRAKVAEGALLLASVIFCAATFGSDRFNDLVGASAGAMELSLGVASVGAFAASLLLLVVDWQGAAALHKDAAERWSRVVKAFREKRTESEEWPVDDGERSILHQLYWEASENSVDIPDRKFNALKARYLLKVEVSKRIEANPGSFPWLVALMVRLRAVDGTLRNKLEGEL